MKYTIAALYCFTPLNELPTLREGLLKEFLPLRLCGTLLLAPEGINGTLSGSENNIEKMISILQEHTPLLKSDIKFSLAPTKPFNRLKIRLKREIITFKQPSADPSKNSGTYVNAKDWNALLDDPDVVVLDTRNDYETIVGSFAGARIPPIHTFTEFASYVQKNLNPERHKKIAMFCTGGIRCEKASAYMKAEGFPEVYHLKGGILKYLEDVPQVESKWNGECYVFDRRIAVGHGLTSGRFSMCFTCGYALSEDDKQHSSYEAGVSCRHCHTTTSSEDKERYRMRQQQMDERPSFQEELE